MASATDDAAAQAMACVVLCSCADLASAQALAGSLVEDRLAACVSLLPGVQSVYRWQGKVQSESEVLLLIKTTSTRVDALSAAIVARHPYELPEVLAVTAGSGLDRYIAWLQAETAD